MVSGQLFSVYVSYFIEYLIAFNKRCFRSCVLISLSHPFVFSDFRDSMFVPASRGPLVFKAFSPSASVVGINSFQFPLFNVFCYQLYLLFWSAYLFSTYKNFSCHDLILTFSHSFYMLIPLQSLACDNFGILPTPALC